MDAIKLEVEIQIPDKRFFEAMENPEGFIPVLAESMATIMLKFRERAKKYAPQSEANQPGRYSLITRMPMGYYERGKGWWFPIVKRPPKQGSGVVKPSLSFPKTKKVQLLRAKGIPDVVGYKLRPSSEQLGGRWTVDVQVQNNEVTGMLSNSASYAGYVQGLEQVQLHQALGWQDVLTTWESDDMQRIVTIETRRAIKEYYNLGGT